MPRLQPSGWLALAAVCLAMACQSKKIDNSMIVEPVTGVSFADDVHPILTNACGGSGCHVGEATSGVELTTYSTLMNSFSLQYGKNIVIPNDGAGSPLVDKISPQPRSGSRMPLVGAPLTSEQVALIRNWIDEGAANN